MPLRVIQVGLGGWGRDWAALLATDPELVEVVGYVDTVPAMLELLQGATGANPARCHATLSAALQATDADAVIVTTALGGHLPVAREAIAAGLPVLVEKPFGPTAEEAADVVAAAESAGVTLMVSQNYRYFPAAQAAAALVREGSLGPVDSVDIAFRRWANDPTPIVTAHHALTHPLLVDMSIHHFDLLRFVLGQEPTDVTCRAWNPPWSVFDDPAEASAVIGFDGGAVATYRGSWASTGRPTPWAGAWTIELAGGIIRWTGRGDSGTDADAVTVIPRGGRPRKLALEPMPRHDRLGSVAEFARAIRDGVAPLTSGRDNLGSLRFMAAVVEAADSGRPVRL